MRRAITLPPYADEGLTKTECITMIRAVLKVREPDLIYIPIDQAAWELLLDMNAVVQRHEVIGIRRYDDVNFSWRPDDKHNVALRAYIDGHNYEYGPSKYHDVGSDDTVLSAVHYLDSLQRLECAR